MDGPVYIKVNGKTFTESRISPDALKGFNHRIDCIISQAVANYHMVQVLQRKIGYVPMSTISVSDDFRLQCHDKAVKILVMNVPLLLSNFEIFNSEDDDNTFEDGILTALETWGSRCYQEFFVLAIEKF